MPHDSIRPRAISTFRLDLFTDQGKAIQEPFHVAGGWDGLSRVAPPADPVAVIDAARSAQAVIVTRVLRATRQDLKKHGLRIVGATVLTGRGRTNDLDATLKSHAQIHVAEGELVRESLRVALKGMRLGHTNQDEKSAMARAADALGIGMAAFEQELKAHRPPKGDPWTKEHKTLTAAAWLSMQA